MKKYIKEFAFSVVLLVLFNVIAFVVPFVHSKNFWISYAFGLVAILLFIGSCLYCDKANKELCSKFYSWPIVRVTFVYGIVQIIVSILGMAIPGVPSWIFVLLDVIMLCVAAIGLIAVDSAKDIIEAVDQKVQGKVFYIRSLVADVEGMIDNANDALLREKLKELAEAIQYSDPMSSEQLYPLESKIASQCAELSEMVENHESENAIRNCNSILKLMAERSRKCAILK